MNALPVNSFPTVSKLSIFPKVFSRERRKRQLEAGVPGRKGTSLFYVIPLERESLPAVKGHGASLCTHSYSPVGTDSIRHVPEFSLSGVSL